MTLPTSQTLPYSFTRDSRGWAALWNRANTQTVRLAVLGDSRCTDPAGLGYFNMENLNFEFAKRFGNCPGTPLTCFWSNSMWGEKDTAPGDGTFSATSLVPNQTLPNANPVALNYTSLVTQTPFLGYLTICRPDNTDGGQGSLLADPLLVNAKTIDPTGGVYSEMYLATRASSNQVQWNYIPRASGFAFYYDAVAQSGNSSLPLSNGTYNVFRYTTPLLAYDPAKPFPQISIAAKNNDGTKVEFLGMRWLSASNPAGVLIDSWSAGGYMASSIPAGFANCAPLVQAMTYDVMMFVYGANDSANGVSAAQFQIDAQALIAFMRTAAGNPNLKFILVADQGRLGLTSGQQTEYDQYAGALYTIAQTDGNCLFVNTRRMAEDAAFKNAPYGNPTISIATPSVVTMANTFALNNAVTFSTTGALPTGLVAGQTYYVSAAGLSTSSFQVSATPSGASVNTSGSQSGTHTLNSTAAYTIDGVHNTAAGGRLWAQLAVSAAMGVPTPQSPGLRNRWRLG